MSLTIKDIAKMANVSHATVSRVINNHDNVSPETREKILRIIKGENFVAKSSARSLVTGKSFALGILILYDLFSDRFPRSFLPSILSGMTYQLMGTEYDVILFFNPIKNGIEELNLENIRQKVDGLFVLSNQNNPQLLRQLDSLKLPLLVINQRIVNADNLSYIISDDVDGAYRLACHLLEQGHREIAYLGVDRNRGISCDREEGFDKACAEYGGTRVIKLFSDGTADHAYSEVKKLLEQNTSFTAIMAGNDCVALGALNALGEKGLRVPTDVALVGYDSWEFSEWTQPGLTTMKRPRSEIGREAARTMLGMIEGKLELPVQLRLKNELIIRESSIYTVKT